MKNRFNLFFKISEIKRTSLIIPLTSTSYSHLCATIAQKNPFALEHRPCISKNSSAVTWNARQLAYQHDLG